MHYRVIRMAKGGLGVSSETGKIFFVEGALPDECGDAEILEEKERFGRCRAITRECNSKYRNPTDVCPNATSCDGCGFRHVLPEFALSLKAEAIHAEILKGAHLTQIPHQLLAIPELDNTRHRVRLHAIQGKLGFFARGTHQIISAAHCAVITPNLRNAIQWLESHFPARESFQIDIQLDQDIRHAIFAHFRVPETRILKKNQHRPGARNSLPAQPHPSLNALYPFAHSAIESGIFSGIRIEEQFFGEPWMKDEIEVNGIQTTSWRRIGDFGQATPQANALIHKLVDDFLRDKNYQYVVDLYAGSGNLSFRAAVRVPHVDAFEFFCDEKAFSLGIQDSRHAWAPNTNVQLQRCDLSKGLPKSAFQADAIICDPARDGLSDAIATNICHAKANSLLYISCEASCLARDLIRLAPAFELKNLTYVDMFPQTPLIETIAYLQRK